MQVSDVTAFVRTLISEPLSTGARWTDTSLALFVNEACQDISLEIDFPEASLYTLALPNQPEYTLLPYIKLYRVKLNGQLVPPTKRSYLEGDEIQVWDQSAPNMRTQWETAPPAAYPVGSILGTPNAPVTFIPGRRPSYYPRGGNIGFVPAPSLGGLIQVDCLLPHPQVSQPSDPIIWPPFFKRAIAFKVIEWSYRADTDMESADNWAAQFDSKALPQLRSWLGNSIPSMPTDMIVRSYRSFYNETRGNLTTADPAGVLE